MLAAATKLLRTPELTSPIFVIIAEGVRGGVKRRSESVVVCDLRSVVVILTISSGVASAVELGSVESAFDVAAREDWKCASSVCVVLVTLMRFCMEFSGVLDFGGMAVRPEVLPVRFVMGDFKKV